GFAISTSAEARSQESGISAISRAAKLSEDIAESERSAQLLDQPIGIELARTEARRFLDTAEAATNRLINVSPALRLRKRRDATSRNSVFLDIYRSNGLHQRLEYHQPYTNTARNDHLDIFLFIYTDKNEKTVEPATIIAERKFVPFITLDD